MKINKKILLGMGLILTPVTILTVASCTSPTDDKTKEINDELGKVTLDFPNKENVDAKTVKTTSIFTSGSFDKEKYDLEIVSVAVGTNNTSVSVTIRLNEKTSSGDTKLQSGTRIITITRFKEPNTLTTKDPQTIINDEVAKVTLDVANKKDVFASSIDTNAKFISGGFDEKKYNLEIVDVVLDTNKTSVLVTLYLKKITSNDTILESKTRKIKITGFKSPTISDAQKSINNESFRVNLSFPNAANTLASSLSTTSNFEKSNYNEAKYDLKIIKVEVTDDKTSVYVSIKLVEKTTNAKKLESPIRRIKITGFKNPNTNIPVTSNPMETNALKAANSLKTFLYKKIDALQPKDILTFSGNVKSRLDIIKKLSESSKLEFNPKTLTAKANNNELFKFKISFFDSVKKGIEYLFTQNGGKLSDLSNVLTSKAGSITTLTSSIPIKKVVIYLNRVGTFKNDWETNLKKGLDRKNFEFKFNFKNKTISIKTDDKTFTELVSFTTEFADQIKDALKALLTNLTEKELENNKSDVNKEINETLVSATIDSLFSLLWNGEWTIKKNDEGSVDFTHSQIETTVTNNN